MLAEKHCLIPIFVRRIRGYGDTLYLAMDDPSDDVAKREIEQYSGLPVRAMIAPPSDIRAAIAAYYGASEPPASMRSGPPGNVSSAPPSVQGLAASPPGSQVGGSAGSESEPPDSGPVIEAHEVTMPPPRRKPSTPMVTVTLLDGTQVNLPAKGSTKGKAKEGGSDEGLTARDMVAALRAVSHGADASEVLGADVNWQAMFAALLSLLLKKHLIADWEFVEEFKRI
jgi:type IV pilus assembly protein PilB